MRRLLAALSLLAVIATGCGGAAPGTAGQAPAGASKPAETGTLAHIHQTGQLTYAWATWFPYAYKDPKTNETTGIAIALARDLAAHMGVKLVLAQDSWSTIVGGLQSGRYDLALPMIPNPVRSKAADFSQPVMQNAYTAVVLKKNLARLPSLASVDKPDVTVVVTLGSNADTFTQSYLKQAKILHVKGAEDEVLSLESGRADAMFTGTDQAAFLLKQYPNTAIVSGEAGRQDISFTVAKGDQAFIDYLNGYIAQIKSSGKLLGFIEQSGLNGTFLPK